MPVLARLTADAPRLQIALERLLREDALGQLIERRGRMADLGTELDDVKLDWVDRVAWVLDNPATLDELEALAASIKQSGIRHLIWSGMGGSVQVVRSLCRLGLLGDEKLPEIRVHPLDSTDPAALNRLLREIAPDGNLKAGLHQTMMVAVSMGMTSEEPITHIEWFEGLLGEEGLDPGSRITVMALSGSYLDSFARDRGARRLDIQLDGGNHTPGRMSAPSTRVFLLPAALALAGRQGALRGLLNVCQLEYQLRPGLTVDDRARIAANDPFVRLAAWLSAQVEAGRDMLVLDLPERWRGLAPWVEQVVEESLGKQGRGLLIFYDQDLTQASTWPDRFTLLRIDQGTGVAVPNRPLAVVELQSSSEPADLLAVVARFFAGWNLAVALFGYLQGITFAGQPGVERYKRYARDLRYGREQLPFPSDQLVMSGDGRLALYYGASGTEHHPGHPAAALAEVITDLLDRNRLGYFDLTLNGEAAGPLWQRLGEIGVPFANRVLRRPVKIRSGPRDYHSTEQSLVDGPSDLLSFRVLVRESDRVAAGDYGPRFLHAQALGTLFAMRDVRRPILLAILESADAVDSLEETFSDAADLLSAGATRE